VKTYGVELVDALGRIPEKVDVINFDGTSTINNGNKLEFKYCALRVANGGVLAMTFVAGREQGYERDVVNTLDWSEKRSSFGDAMRATHQSRISLAWAHATAFPDCIIHVQRFKWDVYLSSCGLPMLWTIGQLRLHTPDALRRWRKTRNLNHVGCEFPPVCITETKEYVALLTKSFAGREDIRQLLMSELEHQ
jgi:hypothetical protein